MNKINVLMADDHPLTLEGLRAFLAPSVASVSTVTDGRALVEAALRLKPDLIISDITMPLLNGIDAAIQIKKDLPEAKFVFVTMHANTAYLEAALNTGATGYVLKSAARENVLDAIQTVLKGGIYVSPNLSCENLSRFVDPARAAATLRLSGREREVLQLVAEGKAAKEIGYVLGISPKTVAFHRENIKTKLGVKSTAELTRHAIEQGLV